MKRLFNLYIRYCTWWFRKINPGLLEKLERYESLERIARVQLIVVVNTIYSTGTSTFRKSQSPLMKCTLEELVVIHDLSANSLTGISSMFGLDNGGNGLTVPSASDGIGSYLDIMVVG